MEELASRDGRKEAPHPELLAGPRDARRNRCRLTRTHRCVPAMLWPACGVSWFHVEARMVPALLHTQDRDSAHEGAGTHEGTAASLVTDRWLCLRLSVVPQ